MHVVYYNGQTSSCELLFLLLYSTERTVIWRWPRPVSDSRVSCYLMHLIKC